MPAERVQSALPAEIARPAVRVGVLDARRLWRFSRGGVIIHL
ncbi:hypothetical protein [Streptomyces sp. IMTB 1903]|nr:hypothetical protein [Streptomyces sp. IMTB 1903]